MKKYVKPMVEVVSLNVADAFSSYVTCAYWASEAVTPDNPNCSSNVMLGMGWVDSCKNYNTKW